MANRDGCQAYTARLFARQHGVVHRHQVFAAGGTPRMVQRRLEGGEWLRVHEGVYRLAAAPVTWHQRLMAACLAADGVASHRAAARLWGLDLETEQIEVTRVGGARRGLVGVRLHRTRALRRGERAERDGIPCTSPSRTLLDLAAVVPADDLEAALDAALREGLTSVRYLERRLETVGRRGGEALRALLADRQGQRAFESRREAAVAKMLVAAGLPRPVPQYELKRGGKVVARFDLAWPDVKVAVEFASYRHHFGRQAWRSDARRANRAAAEGWRLFSLTEDDGHEGRRGVAEQIAAARAA